MFREEYIIVQIVNRAFISTLSEIQIRLLFTRSECRYLNVTGHCQQFILTTRPVVLMVLEQSCLPMYQILAETFSWHTLSQQQAIKFCWVPKMRQKLFLTQGKFYGAQILPSLTSLSYLCSCFICRYKVASKEMHFSAFIFIFLSVFVCEINYLSSCRIGSLTINTWSLVGALCFLQKK